MGMDLSPLTQTFSFLITETTFTGFDYECPLWFSLTFIYKTSGTPECSPPMLWVRVPQLSVFCVVSVCIRSVSCVQCCMCIQIVCSWLPLKISLTFVSKGTHFTRIFIATVIQRYLHHIVKLHNKVKNQCPIGKVLSFPNTMRVTPHDRSLVTYLL